MKQLPDDELRARLARLDPIGDRPVEPADSPRAAQQMERAMNTLESPTSTPRGASRRRLVLAGAAGLAAAAAVAGGVYLAVDNPAEEPTTLTLALPASDVMASCLPFDVQFLADMSPAFAGTAMEVDANEIVLDVDRWYTGGDADRVRLQTPDGTSSAALDGVDFVEGRRYLVTAAQGTVNGCGYSGPATRELEQAFETAFAG